MKKKILALTCCLAMALGLLAGCSSGSGSQGGSQSGSGDVSGSQAGADAKIALITMDPIDQHWVTLNEGAQKAAEELGVTLVSHCRDGRLRVLSCPDRIAG